MSFTPEHFTVWAEIPVSDLNRAIAFYNAVFDIELKRDESGPNPMAVFPTSSETGVGGHLYEGKAAGDGSGPTVHFACPTPLEETFQRVKDSGGQVTSPPIAIPAGRFAYCIDPDGNSIGLFTK